MKRLAVLFSLLALLLGASALVAQNAAPTSADAWRADLQFLWQNIRNVHPDPFRSTPQADFERMVSDLDTAIPELTDEQIVVRLFGIVAALKDGHSYFWFTGNDYPFRYYPLLFYPFSDGVYLIGAAPAQADLVGSKLVQIGDTSIDAVLERLLALAPHDNDSSRLVTIPMLLSMTDALLGTGITADADQPAYHLERPDGEPVTINPAPVDFAAYRAAIPVAWRLPARAEPLALSRLDESFWWTYLEADRTFYVQYNAVVRRDEATGTTLGALVDALDEAVTTLPLRRVILDMRYNGGGDINTALPLRDEITRTPFFRQPGSLIVLTGRNTFSAAVVFSLWLEQSVDPVFIGEPTGGKPLMFENARRMTLPNSRLTVQIATRARRDVDVSDPRQAVEPDVRVDPSAAAYFAAADPVLAAALAYSEVS